MQAVPLCSDTAGITGTKFFRDYPNEPFSTTFSVSASKIPSSCSELFSQLDNAYSTIVVSQINILPITLCIFCNQQMFLRQIAAPCCYHTRIPYFYTKEILKIHSKEKTLRTMKSKLFILFPLKYNNSSKYKDNNIGKS
ncbi:hypothetical protein C6P41_001513 [Kluyveromyces marxianus]|nr:hypothetical protein C6P43_001809 [Kluyveromyces marxianus]KAG0677196.1 hypothetical protein C6P41_001513 [Kluyveromyces marxianus]